MASSSRRALRGAACLVALALSAGGAAAVSKAEAPIPTGTLALIAARDTSPAAPILMRVYKKEAELEVWKKARSGRYVLLKTFPICRWSGQLGPKLRQGDRQAPEGFYAVAPRQMNPNSAYYLSFDTGFPNAFDRAHGATGSALMVHGTCSSAGCFAMTDTQVGEIFALAREAFAAGQGAFQFQSYPFRMTALNMARHRTDPNIGFWRQLKEGSDRFEATGEEPALGVAGGRYVFAPSRDPAREALAAARRAEEDGKVASLVADGAAAVRTTYADGGQHPAFTVLARLGAQLGDVSRPEALALAGREVVVIPARARKTLLAGIEPPPRPRSGPEAEPSLFAATALAAPWMSFAGVGATIAGAARIRSAALATSRPQVMAQR